MNNQSANFIQNIVLAVSFLTLIFGCSNSKKYDLSISPDDNHHFIGLLSFSNSAFDSVILHLNDSIKTNSITLRPNQELIKNLSANKTYYYHYEFYKDGVKHSGNQKTFKTKEYMSDVSSLKLVKGDYRFADGILLKSFFLKGFEFIINEHAEIVWYHDNKVPTLRAFREMNNGNGVWSFTDSTTITGYSYEGDTLVTHDMKSINLAGNIHHDFQEDINGNLLVINYVFNDQVIDKPLRSDGLSLISSEGKLIWEWDPFDHLDMMKIEINDSNRHDLGHANSVLIDYDNNYLISYRDFNQIWKVNSRSGEVIWVLGFDGDFNMESNALFIGQHSISRTKKGNLLLFDNGSGKIRPRSRLLELKLNEVDLEVEVVNSIWLSDELSSFRMCSVYEMGENYLVCTTKKHGWISVVSKNGDILWQAMINPSSYRAYPVNLD